MLVKSTLLQNELTRRFHNLQQIKFHANEVARVCNLVSANGHDAQDYKRIAWMVADVLWLMADTLDDWESVIGLGQPTGRGACLDKREPLVRLPKSRPATSRRRRKPTTTTKAK